MSIEFSNKAAKVISKMDATTKGRIMRGILGLPNGDIKPFKGATGTYRLRIGNWRILFSYADDDTILIEKISPRGSAYKGA
jgi:mRNA interferase RelE/StbE